MYNSKKLDEHSPTHFLGFYALVLTLVAWSVSLWLAVLISLAAGFAWEFIGDEFIYKKKNCCLGAFDDRGGDWTDIIVNISGVLLATVVLLLAGVIL